MTIAAYFLSAVGLVPVILGALIWLKQDVRLLQPHQHAAKKYNSGI